MRSLSRAAGFVVAVAALSWGLTGAAVAAETSNAEFVIIQEDDVFPDDLYAGAIRVVVAGRLEGDLIAFAAEDVVISGTVTGSVLAVAPSVTVTGDVEGSLRVVGHSLEVSGTVGEDVVGTVWSATLSPESVVGGDVLLWAWQVEALGTIGADLTGTQRHLRLAGRIDGDVEVSVNDLEIVDSLVVAGDLGYRSNNTAEGLELAEVGGTVVNQIPLPPNLRVRALSVLGRFMIVLFLSLAALTAAYGWPRRTTDAITAVGRSPVRKWLWGALIVFAPLIAVAVTGVIVGLAPAAAAFPLLAVLVPVILALIGISFALAFVAGAPAVGWLGGVLFKRLDLYGSILAGSAIVGAVWYVPYLGLLVPVVVLPLGLGAWMSTWRRSPTAVSAES
ncbi:MAG TPA: hypothetical protein VFS66_14900 [Acidimicrobiia bacterium]|nr:hypothetical protein [Acidimicrobiia bacterium]